MNVSESRSDWLQQASLDGIDEIRVDADTVSLEFEADETLSSMVQLIVEPAQNAPTMMPAGSQLLIEQQGRYRGRVTPMIRLPASMLPGVEAHVNKGDLSFSDVSAALVVNLGMGDLIVRGGSGEIALKIGKGDVRISDRAEAIAASVGMGDIAVNRCRGPIALETGKGDVAVARCGSDVDVRLGSGDVAIGHPEGGHVAVTTGGGDVAVGGGRVAGLRIRTGKGNIASSTRLILHPEDATDEASGNEAFTHDDFAESIDALGVNLGDLELEAGEGGLRIARGNRDLLKLGPEGIRISRGGREISLGPDGIRVGGAGSSAGPDHFTFDTGRGDVHVDLPSDLQMRVEVLATGDVQSDVPLVSVGRPGPRGTTKRLVGVRDGGESGPRANVRIKTGRGDVELRMVRVPAAEQAPKPESKTEIDRDERARVILEALSRGDLSVSEAERLLAALDRSG